MKKQVRKLVVVRKLVGEVLDEAFISKSETGSCHQRANVVDGMFAIARAIHTLAAAVRELCIVPKGEGQKP